jgi:alkylhydroperoxidase family enzyme
MAASPVTGPRIAPLEPPYDAQVGEALAKWMPPGAAIEPLRLFRTMMVNPELSSRMRPLGAGILGAGATVPPLLREVVIHRTCALTRNDYEWGVHAAAFGAPLGLSPEQLRSTVHGSHEDACWDAEQACVFRLAGELHAASAISDELWAQLAGRFSERQLIELIVTAGWYHVIAYLCNGLRVEPEEWATPVPGPERPTGH